jgi:nicotinamidase-related amidase
LAIGDKVIPIHHHRQDENYSFNSDALDDVVKSFVAPLEGEDVAIKHGDSGFVDTSLEQILGDAGIEHLVVCGATANYVLNRVLTRWNISPQVFCTMSLRRFFQRQNL